MLDKFRSKIALNVKGKNINRFIKKLTTRKIDILSLKYINQNEVEIIIYKDDYNTVIKIKSIYEVLEKDVFGYVKIKKILKVNKHLIILFILGFLFFLILTNVIFDIEVVHSSKDVRNLVTKELEANGIKKYTIKKSYNELEKIKEKILYDHPNDIEWLEIETMGTKYVVRVEDREIIKNHDSNKPRNLVAKKDGVLKKVTASNGDILRNSEDYVKKGDIIVNGEVMLNEKSMGKVKAEGKAYAEVWYIIKTEYPFAYYEEKETGKKKETYAVKFLNREIELGFNKYKHKKVKEDSILSHPLLPIKLVKQKQKEITIRNDILTFDEALIKAEDLSEKKIQNKLKEDEYIIRSKYLKSMVKKSTIEVEMFFAVYEDITDYQEIE